MFLNNKPKNNGATNQTESSCWLALTFVSSFLLPVFYLLSLYTLTNSCAQQQQLTGGPRDTFPPKLITELSTPNFQTNFQKQPIDLVFDEYIDLRDVVKQLVVSPPLTYIPKLERQKGFKTARFIFDEDEVLREGVTYAINYGKSIRDLTESNEVENLQFLFSTGDYIDSLKMSGSIVDALTGEPVPEVLFMLYENFADTVVRTEKPYYFGKADKNGEFTINYLKEGDFKGFALLDQDLNYLFNTATEQIGFTLDTVFIRDSLETEVRIRLFEEELPLGKPKVEASTYGFIKLGFKRTPYDVALMYDSLGQRFYREIEGDTIRYWYDLVDTVDWNFYFRRDTLIDTLTIKNLPKEILPLRLAKDRKAGAIVPINPFKPLPFTFNYPLRRVDTSFINFRAVQKIEGLRDSTTVAVSDSLIADSLIPDSILVVEKDSSLSVLTDSTNQKIDTTFVPLEKKGERLAADWIVDSTIRRTLQLNFNWSEGQLYEVEILPQALVDWYDRPNEDTITLRFEAQPVEDFGTINLTVTEMDSTKAYWFQLLLGKNQVSEFSIVNQRQYRQSFPALLPGKYSLKVIEDLNANGRWDTGNYDEQRQPEKISTAEIEALRAGWDVD
ncbi:MAG: Ig-like domain-containing protein, partial [Bacteroidota bacterium]